MYETQTFEKECANSLLKTDLINLKEKIGYFEG